MSFLQTLSLSNASPDDSHPYKLKQIKKIHLSNFKSFQGTHTIGPFTPFTFVIGPNGGGKSNVLDAISFVLGLGLKDMRCTQTDQLIYNKSVYYQTTQLIQQDHTAYVEITFEPSDLRLKRTLQVDGSTQVYLNDKLLEAGELSQLLVSSNLMARNFIMLQGETDQLTVLEPVQLTEYFERLSGSIRFKEEYEQVAGSLEKVKYSIRNVSLSKLGLKQEHKKVKDLRQSAQYQQQLNGQIAELKEQLYLRQLWEMEEQVGEYEELMREHEDERDEESEKHRIITSLQANDLDMKHVKRELNQLNSATSEQLLHKLTHLRKKAQLGQHQQEQAAQLKQQQLAQREMIDEIQMDLNQLDNLTRRIPKQYQDDYAKLVNAMRLPQSLLQQATNIDKIIAGLEQQLHTSNQNQTELTDITQQIQHTTQKLQTTQERLDSLAQTHQREQQALKDLLSEREDLEKSIQVQEYQLAENIEEEETRHLVQQMYGMFPSFIGELSSLCNPVTPQYAVPLKVALGQRLLKALIVTSTSSAVQINKFLKSIGMVKELVLLDKVKVKKELKQNNDEIRSTIQGIKKCTLAADVIEVSDAQLQPLIDDLLKGVVFCDTYQNAVQLLKRRVKHVHSIITLDGIQLQSSGMILYQRNLNHFRNFRQNNQRTLKKDDLQKLQKGLEQVNENISQLKETSHSKEVQELSALKARLEEQLRELEVQLRWCKLSEGKQNKGLEEELKLRREQREQVQRKISEQQDQCKEDIRRLAEKTGVSEEELRQGDSEVYRRKNRLLDGMSEAQQRLKEIELKLRRMREEEEEHARNLEQVRSLEEQLESASQKKEKEKTLKGRLKSLQEEEKRLLGERDALVRRSTNRKQEVASWRRKVEMLESEKQLLVEECEMESVELKREPGSGKIVYPETIKAVKKEELEQQIKQKEKLAAQHLSDNLQTGLIGSDQKFNQIEVQLKQLSDKLTVLHDEQAKLTEQLHEIKNKRIEQFNALFKRVSEEVEILYETLTFQGQLKGSAVLYLENKDEPFNGGIIYTPTPANKRYVFDNQEQLSGGEKAIASLALFFALNSAVGCPFILLDEVDANLDVDNIQRLRLVMQTQSDANQIQFISVSHNLELFQHGTSLIGVTIQHGNKTSEAFSLQL